MPPVMTRIHRRRARAHASRPAAPGTRLRRLLSASATAAVAASLLVVAPSTAATTTSTAQVTIRQTTEPSQVVGSAHHYAVKWACLTTASSVCATDASVVIPFDVPSASVKVATGAGTHVESWTRENGAITLQLGTIAAGASGEVPLTVTTQNWHTPNATSWTLAPTFFSSATGAVVSTTSATSTATGEVKLAVLPSSDFSHYTAGAPLDLRTHTTTYCNIATGVGVTGVTRLKVEQPLPAGLRFISAENDGEWNPDTRTVTWDRSSPPGSGIGCDLNTRVRAEMGTAADGLTEDQELNVSPTLTVWPNDGSDPVTMTGPLSVRFTSAAATAGTVTSYGNSPFLHTAGESQSRTTGGAYRTGVPATTPISLSPTFGSQQPSVQSYLDQPAGTTYPGVEFQPACRVTPAATVHQPSASGELCTDPAYNVYAVAVSHSEWPFWPEFENATPPADWITARLTDGSVVNLTPEQMAFDFTAPVPSEYLGRVASIRIKAVPGVSMGRRSVDFRGTADADLAAGTELRHATHVTWHARTGGVVVATTSDTAITYVAKGLQRELQWTGMISAGAYTPGNLTDDLTLTAVLPNGEATARTGTVPDSVWVQPWSTDAQTDPDVGQTGKTFDISWTPVPNWQGTGSTLLRSKIPAERVNALLRGGPGYLFAVPSFNPNPHGVDPVTIPYTLHYSGAVTDVCKTGGHASAPTTRVTSDPTDVDANPATTEYCRLTVTAAAESWNAPASSMQVTTHVSTPANPTYATAPKTAATAANAAVSYRASWVNNGQQDLSSVGIYTRLPRPGDTGLLPHSTDIPRGSTITPTLTGLGALPAGTQVQYSRADNPCRPELAPDDATCTDDWTTTAPSDLGTVTALKFTVPGEHPYGTRLTFNWQMRTPAGANGAAYATAAAFASTASDALPPVESAPATAATVGYQHLSVRTWAENTDNGGYRKDKTGDFRVEAANDGLTPQTVTQFVDTLPTQFTPVYISGGGIYDPDTHTVTWPGSTLAPGERFAAAVTGRFNQTDPADQATNRFTARGAPAASSSTPCADGSPADACVTFTLAGVPHIRMISTAAQDTAAVGDEVEFTFRATNDGSGRGRATWMEVPYMSDELELLTSTPDVEYDYDYTDWAGYKTAAFDDKWLEPGDTFEATLRFRVLPAAAGKTLNVGVNTWGDEEHVNRCDIIRSWPGACDSIAVDPAAPDVVEVAVRTEVCTVLELSACDTNPALWGSASEAPTGGEAYWRVSARNQGTVDLTGVTVTHPLAEGLELVPGSAHATVGDLTDWPDTWIVGDLEGNKAATLTYRTRTPAVPAQAVSRATLVADNPDDSSFPLTGFSEATLQVSDWGVRVSSRLCSDPDATSCDPSDESHWTDRPAAPAGSSTVVRTTVTNTGTAPLRHITVQAPLNGPTTLPTKASATAGTLTNTGQTWKVDRLEAGKTVTLTRPVTLPKAGGKVHFPAIVTATMASGDQEGKTLTDSDEAVISTRASKGAANVTLAVEGCRLTKSNCLRNGRKHWSAQPDLTARNGILWRVVVANTGTVPTGRLAVRGTRTVTTTAGSTRSPLTKVRSIRTLQPGQRRVLMLRTSAPRFEAVVGFKASVRTRAGSQVKLVAKARTTVRIPVRPVPPAPSP